ncbi:MAG: hypothetical protein RR826_01285, partial [Christensenellaceae bacterium]
MPLENYIQSVTAQRGIAVKMLYQLCYLQYIRYFIHSRYFADLQIIAPFASSPISVALSLIFTMKKPPCLEWHQCFL